MPYYLTRESLGRLREKVGAIQMRLKIEVAQELAKAAAFKDLSENAEWDAALELQANLKHEASKILEKLQDPALIEELSIDGSRVTIGTQVTLFDLDRNEELTYKILGEEESDLRNGIIAFAAPLARGLLQKEEGDKVSIQLPGGVRSFEILSVEKIDFKNNTP
ncbi:MAG: GreA/GreB family elongation factor [bacterium]|nr:GreA/GreB family elongation factor [bacterium]